MHMNEKAKKTPTHSPWDTLNQQPLPLTSDDGKIRNWGSTRQVWTDPVLTRRDGVIHYRALLNCTPSESVFCTSDTCTATTAFEMRSVLPDWISGLRGHEATCCTAGFNEEIRKEEGRRMEGGGRGAHMYRCLNPQVGHTTPPLQLLSVSSCFLGYLRENTARCCSCFCTGLFWAHLTRKPQLPVLGDLGSRNNNTQTLKTLFPRVPFRQKMHGAALRN